MRQLITTASVFALLAAAPAAALAQPAGPQGGNMPDQNMMSGQNMPGSNMSGPNMPGPNMPGPGMPGMGMSNMGPNGQPMQRMGPYRRERGMQASEQDRRFVDEATSAGLAEIAAGHMALDRAAEPAVTEFGRWMITDHSELDDTLSYDAERAGIFVPHRIAAQQRAMLDRLHQYNGAEFDLHYVNDQIEAHEQALGLFEREAQYGANPLLRGFAHHSHWILEQHLAEAQALRSIPQSSTSRAAHMAAAPMAPMTEAVHATPHLQSGTTPAARHELNKEGAKVIKKASP